MPDKIFDVIIIGAGHNGLALGTYLAQTGLEVAVFEKRSEEGGGLATEELTRPGFLHNTHANYHTMVGVSPVYEHLELEQHGLRYVRPKVQMGSVFDDGTALTIHTSLEKTHLSLSRFSSRDADTFCRFYNETKGYLDFIIRTLMFTPPLSIKDIAGALAAWGVEDKTEFLSPKLRMMTINEFLDKHFENDKVKAHLAFHAGLAGYAGDRPGLAVSLPLLFGKIDNYHLCQGGSHALAHSLWEAFAQKGGRVFLQRGVQEILIEDGKAKGVKLEDGQIVTARKMVASSIDVEQTFLRMVKPANLKDDFKKKAGEVSHMDSSLFSVHLAMNQAPQYKAADFDPDINRAWVVNVGYENLEDLNRHWRDVRAGLLPEPKPNCVVNSLFDPLDAPEGYYTGLIRHTVPCALQGGDMESWRDAALEYGERCIQKWKEAAPNLEKDVILEWTVRSPLDIAENMPSMPRGDWLGGLIDLNNMLDQRPFPELSQYQTPIKNLYMCGATQHPHGFITFAPAYNALQVIAEEHNLEPWWI